MDPVPPAKLIKMVGGVSAEDYGWLGAHFFEIFIKYARLKATDRVLDVGCGCGRMAMPLTKFLTTGSYEGFDVIPELVAWCRENITPRWPAFRFQLADVYNKTYHPRGRTQARDYVFPYPDGTFDSVYLTSVFTHMLPEDMAHYTREIARTLKRGGAAMVTFFLLNEESMRLKDGAGSKISLKKSYLDGQVLVMKRWKPEAAVGYPEEAVRQVFAQSDLALRGEILYGNWCGRPAGVSLQDVTVWQKV